MYRWSWLSSRARQVRDDREQSGPEPHDARPERQRQWRRRHRGAGFLLLLLAVFFGLALVGLLSVSQPTDWLTVVAVGLLSCGCAYGGATVVWEKIVVDPASGAAVHHRVFLPDRRVRTAAVEAGVRPLAVQSRLARWWWGSDQVVRFGIYDDRGHRLLTARGTWHSRADDRTSLDARAVGTWLVLVSAVFCAVMAFGAAAVVGQDRSARVDGEVTAVDSWVDTKTTHCHITVTYQVGSEARTEVYQASDGDWFGQHCRSYSSGSAVTVYYDPSDPGQSQLDPPPATTTGGLVVGGLCLLVAVFLWRTFLLRRQRELGGAG